MKTLNAVYVHSSNATLAVQAKQGNKPYITVSVRLRTPDGKSSVGCRETFGLDKEADAVAAWERRKAEAVKIGWTERIRTPRNQSFMTIPAPPAITPNAPTKPQAKKGRAA